MTAVLTNEAISFIHKNASVFFYSSYNAFYAPLHPIAICEIEMKKPLRLCVVNYVYNEELGKYMVAF